MLSVVSFYAPRPEHPFFRDYRPYLALLRESCVRYGHTHRVLTDAPDEVGGDDAYTATLPRALMPATLAAQHAWLADPTNANTPTLFVGADCVLANDPACFAEIAAREHGADIVITVDDRFTDCRMNTGAIYIPRPHRLAPVWATALEHVGTDWGDDQTSLYLAIQQAACRSLRVIEVPCDPYNLAPDHPSDDCTRGVVLHFRGDRKRWMTSYCHTWLRIGEGVQQLIAPNESDDAMLANVAANLGRDYATVKPIEAHDGHAVLVGGGPSAADCLDEIRWRQDHGQQVFALNGAAWWLVKNRVIPDFGIVLDARAKNVHFVQGLGNVSWLLASQCHPDLFGALRGSDLRMWHFMTRGISALVSVDATLISGGLTSGLSAMCLAYTLGYRKLHLYGYDSSDRGSVSRPYDQAEVGAETRRVEVWCDGQPFSCGVAMYKQAEQFPYWAKVLGDAGAIITVHGDGLLPTVARCMTGAVRLTMPTTQQEIAA